MTIAEGHFQLYPRVTPALKAGDYLFTTSQLLSAQTENGGLEPADLPVQNLETHLRVTSPRYLLPPDQVLSTYPPAGTEGAYGARLPQVVIKRRTLPWERAVDGGDDKTPWLALVVFAEGEAEFLANVPVADCVTPGVQLSGPVDVDKGACLSIRRSMVAKIMPTQLDVPLLAHAREVNINDTELMLGDDDGYLAVVVANRLPVAGRNPDGTEAAVKYHAALISLEGRSQFGRLLPESPPQVLQTEHMVFGAKAATLALADYDRQVMGVTPSAPSAGSPLPAATPHVEGQGMAPTAYRTVVSQDAVPSAFSGTGEWQKVEEAKTVSYFAVDTKGVVSVGMVEALDPEVRFPALLHWTFTSVGDVTFELLMREADSGLLGTLGQHPTAPQGRKLVEVVETGHVGLDQRTRRGDTVRAWYRGPLLPHPADLTAPRLPLAHTGDQLRAVIPDGREDLSLAAAFEIGRLLALSQPSMVAALLRWRQRGYQAARIDALWDGILTGLDIEGVDLTAGQLLGIHLGRGLARAIANNPAEFIGPPHEVLTAGTPMGLGGDPLRLVAQGFGIEVATDMPMTEVLGALRSTEVPRMSLTELGRAPGARMLMGALAQVRDASLTQLAAGALSKQVMAHPGAAIETVPSMGGVIAGLPVVGPHDETVAGERPDALDRALAGETDHEEHDA